MSESKRTSGPQFRADHPETGEAVHSTFVGGQQPRSEQQLGPIPRGVEVLIKKASVDVPFRRLLLAERAEAARQIGLTLEPAEAMMLTAVPAEQLKAIIDRTTVPREHRRAFLGATAATMLAAVGLISPGCGSGNPAPAGIAPDDPAVDENGRPKRNIMAEEGGAAPSEPPNWRDDPEPSRPQDGSAEEGGAEPADSPDPSR